MHIALKRGPPRVIWAMLTVVLALLLVPGCDSAPASEEGNPATGRPVVGSLAPDFTLTDLDGNSVRLQDLRGQVVFLNFWATWCPPCRAEMPDIEALHRKYRDRGVVVLGVDLRESESGVRAYVEGGGYTRGRHSVSRGVGYVGEPESVSGRAKAEGPGRTGTGGSWQLDCQAQSRQKKTHLSQLAANGDCLLTGIPSRLSSQVLVDWFALDRTDTLVLGIWCPVLPHTLTEAWLASGRTCLVNSRPDRPLRDHTLQSFVISPAQDKLLCRHQEVRPNEQLDFWAAQS